MKKIKNITISLLEKDGDFSINEDSKGNYIKKSTSSFSVDQYLSSFSIDEVDDEEYDNFIMDLCVSMYNDLLSKSQGINCDSIGLWVEYMDGTKIENAMDLWVLDSIGEFGEKDVIPFLEFFQMSLQRDEAQVS